MKKIITLMFSLIIVVSLSVTAFADGSSCKYSIFDCTCGSDCESCLNGYCSLNIFNVSSFQTFDFSTVNDNGDGSFFVEHLNNGQTGVNFLCDTVFSAGSYKFYLNCDTALISPNRIYIFFNGSQSDTVEFVDGVCEFTRDDSFTVTIQYRGFQSASFTFSPMMTFADNTDDTFVPYGCSCAKTEPAPDNPDTPNEPDNPNIEYIYIKENRPLFETPLSDYSVTEGLLLLILVITLLNNIFKTHIRG